MLAMTITILLLLSLLCSVGEWWMAAGILRTMQGASFTPDPCFVAQLKARVLRAVTQQKAVPQ